MYPRVRCRPVYTTFLYLGTAELQYGAVEFRYWSTKLSRIENKCSFVRRENIYGLVGELDISNLLF